jgi:HNH endonuclease
MRRVDKPTTSEIISKAIMYRVKGSNKKLADILCTEQHNICAYTETYLGRTDKKDIDHFNPTLKGRSNDSYENWFLVKAQWNSEKSNKWSSFQSILSPTAADLEDRIIYSEYGYYPAISTDDEAVNLIRLLKLDDPLLEETRKRYINRMKKDIDLSQKIPQQFIDDLLVEDRDAVYFIRAIEEEFNVRVNFDLLNDK